MDQKVNIQNVDPNTLQLQNYTSEDDSLISNNIEDIIFNPSQDYLEYFVLDLNQNILLGDSNFSNYQIQDNSVVIDPKQDLETVGFEEGQYFTIYIFLTPKISSSVNNTFYIHEKRCDVRWK